tara:strand:+ start:378 stop:584 length:207 start_codon:yes stop_codon:yes gene_type:complete
MMRFAKVLEVKTNKLKTSTGKILLKKSTTNQAELATSANAIALCKDSSSCQLAISGIIGTYLFFCSQP